MAFIRHSVEIAETRPVVCTLIHFSCCSRKSPDEVPQAMNASEDRKFAIETKFDGERVQIHVDGKFWTL